MCDYNNQFIICTDDSFSSKDGKCAFGCAFFSKGVRVILFALIKAREFHLD